MNYKQFKARKKLVEAVHHAESEWRNSLSLPRKVVEITQNYLAYMLPQVAYHLNFSVGEYNIRPKTAEKVLAKKGLSTDKKEVVQHVIDPIYSKQVALELISELKKEHPKISQLSWKTINKHFYLLMKLYSGYMGAGGKWKRWKKTLLPGTIAKSRLIDYLV